MLAVCDIGVQYFENYANNAQFPTIRHGGFTLARYCIFTETILFVVNVHMFIYCCNHCIIQDWISVGQELVPVL